MPNLDPEAGESMLSDLVAMIQGGGQMDKASASQLLEALNHWQAKLDLVQIGVTMHEISRLPKVAQHIDAIEAVLFKRHTDELTALDLMETKDLVALLKTVQTDFRNSIEFTANRAVKPQVSSPETMRQIPDQGIPETEAPRLHAVSRNKVRSYLTKLMSSVSVIEAEIVEPKAKPKAKSKKAKPKAKSKAPNRGKQV